MKVAWVADVHLGNHRRMGGPVVGSLNRRCRQILNVLHEAVVVAIDEGCEHFVVAGDLFDYARPEAPLIAAVQAELRCLLTQGCHPWLLLGNHEYISNKKGDNALAPLSGLANIVEHPQILALKERGTGTTFEVAFLPHVAGGASFSEVLELMHGSMTHYTVLCMHAGIADSKTPPWLRDSGDSVPVRDLVGSPLTVAGNWHDAREWCMSSQAAAAAHSTIIQLGALVPTGWDNPGLERYGRVLISTHHNQKPAVTVDEKWLPGPRFVTVRSREEWAALPTSPLLYVRWEALAEDVEHAAALIAVARTAQAICDGEVVLRDGQAVAVVAAAVAKANEADGIIAALQCHIEETPDIQDSDRPEVFQLCRRFLDL